MLFILPSFSLFAQKHKDKDKGTKDIDIVLECVEYIGDGKCHASFGYNNPNSTTVSVPDTSSILTCSKGNKRTKALNTFKAGKQSNVETREFDSDDKVVWTVVLPNGKTKQVTASANSSHCNQNTNIIPYYTPPSTGKITNSIIGPELNSLYNNFITTGTAVSNFIYQVQSNKVLIELKAKTGNYTTLLQLLIKNFGFEFVAGDPSTRIVSGWIPIANLLLLNNLGQYIELTRPEYPPILNNTGLALNLGDLSMHSDFARNGYNINGKGVKIGVISDSYNAKGGAALDVRNGDLPGRVNIN